jgi:hypothetical protein
MKVKTDETMTQTLSTTLFISHLLNATISNSDYTVSNDWMTVHNKIGKNVEGDVVA